MSTALQPIIVEAQRWIAPLGWAIVHFAWQGLIVGAAAWAALTLARSPRVRHAIGLIAMAILLACPIATLAWIGPEPSAAGVARSPGDAAIAFDRPAIAAILHAIAQPATIAPSLHDRLAPLTPTLATAWAIGVALLALRHLVGLAQLARLRRSATPITDAIWRERLARLAGRIGVRRAVALCSTVRLDGPAVVGLLRPTILWPAAALTGLTPSQIESLLAHELAHIARHDFALNLLQTCVETLLFYHPAVWWLGRRVRAERELCCDDLAARAVGDRREYARALVAMESLRATPPLAIGAGGGSMVARVQRLLSPIAPGSSIGRCSASILLGTLAATSAAAWALREGVGRSSPVATPAAITTLPNGLHRVSVGSVRPSSGVPNVRGNWQTSLNDRLSPWTNIVADRATMPDIEWRLDSDTPIAGRPLSPMLDRMSVLPPSAASPSLMPVVPPPTNAAPMPVAVPHVADAPASHSSRVQAFDASPLPESTDDRRATTRASSPRPAATSPAIDDFDAREPFFTRLVQARDDLRLQLEQVRATQGPGSPVVLKLASQLSSVEQRLAQIAEQIRQTSSRPGANVATVPTEKPADSPLARLRALQAQRAELVDALAQATRERGEASNDALAVRGALSQLDAKLAEASGFVGEYFIGGGVERPGLYSLTGRRVTLLQAANIAGAVLPAVPGGGDRDDFGLTLVRRDPATRTERRLSFRWRDVAAGRYGTFYLMPDDQLSVGAIDASSPATTEPAALDARIVH